MILSFKSPFRNPQYPPSTPFFTPPPPDIILIKIWTQNFQNIFPRIKKQHPWHQRWLCPSSHLSGTYTVLQVTLPSWPFTLHDTFLIKIATRNFQGIFPGVKKHYPWFSWWPWMNKKSNGVIPPSKKNYFKTGNFFQLKNLNLLSLNFNQNLLLKNVNYFSTQ